MASPEQVTFHSPPLSKMPRKREVPATLPPGWRRKAPGALPTLSPNGTVLPRHLERRRTDLHPTPGWTQGIF